MTWVIKWYSPGGKKKKNNLENKINSQMAEAARKILDLYAPVDQNL